MTIWPRWQSLLVQSQPFFLVWGTTVIYIKPRLAFPPAAATPRPGSLCCQTPATWTDRLSRGSHPSPPTTRVLKVFKITWSLCACSWWRSLICGFPWESRSREQRGTRTGQPLGQTEQTLSGLFSFGDDWHRPDFPRKLLRFLLLNFFFLFSYFHCVVGVKAVAFGSYFPSALLLCPGRRDLFSLRWNTKALSLFARIRS